MTENERESLLAARSRTQDTTDELEDPTTEGDRRREIEAEDAVTMCNVCEARPMVPGPRGYCQECADQADAGYKPGHDHELAF